MQACGTIPLVQSGLFRFLIRPSPLLPSPSLRPSILCSFGLACSSGLSLPPFAFGLHFPSSHVLLVCPVRICDSAPSAACWATRPATTVGEPYSEIRALAPPTNPTSRPIDASPGASSRFQAFALSAQPVVGDVQATDRFLLLATIFAGVATVLATACDRFSIAGWRP